jgi:hypothetical protein
MDDNRITAIDITDISKYAMIGLRALILLLLTTGSRAYAQSITRELVGNFEGQLPTAMRNPVALCRLA